MNYLLDSGGVELKQEPVTVDDSEHMALGFVVIDVDATCKAITDLMMHVQTIKSTGDGQACNTLI